MGAPPEDVEASQPLMGTPVAVKQPRQWRGHLLEVFGQWEAHDTAACCLAWHAPFVAFGWNSQRAFGHSWIKEALKFLLLAVGLLMVGRMVVCLAMMVACPPPPPPPMGAGMVPGALPGAGGMMGGPGGMGPGGMMMGGKPLVDPKPLPMDMAMAQTTSSTSASWAGPVDEHDDDDNNREGWRHGHGGPMHGHQHGHPGLGHMHALWHGMMDMDGEGPMTPEMEQCMAAVAPAAFVAGLISVAGIAGAIWLASRRRTALRERFGIPGSRCGDVASWAFCGVCALAQETRTLMHNNVEAGLWRGPLDAPPPVTATQA